MSAAQFRGPDAAAFQLAAMLENYEEHIEQLVSTWLDSGLHADVGRELEAMGLVCARLPLLCVPWLHLRISHAELLHSLWEGGAPQARGRCKAMHLDAVRALRRHCLAHFSRVDAVH